MKKVVTKLDKVILFCKNVQKSSSLYSQALGLKVCLQSPQFCQLKDLSNFSIYLQQSNMASQLSKGYSPILSFKVQNFQEIYQKLKSYELVPDGQIVKCQKGSIASFMGYDNQLISINNLHEQFQHTQIQPKQEDFSSSEIKKLLAKIKL